MELSASWDANSCSATQEFPNILWNPKVHYRVYKSPPMAPVSSQINTVHIAPSFLFKIRFNIIHPLSLGLLSGLLSCGLPSKILYTWEHLRNEIYVQQVNAERIKGWIHSWKVSEPISGVDCKNDHAFFHLSNLVQ
jgi:hypothetical protein